MCGIAGWIATDGRISEQELIAMNDAMAHRGPDGSGTWINPSSTVGLAHRRLSIIDVSNIASQPMSDAAGTVCIVFNGEIYNHRDLRKQLENLGRNFKTNHSDTECLIHGYLEWGLNGLLSKLVGMFAFAIYDNRSSTLTLVRDRVGVKPLYYCITPAGLLFASEIKSLLAHPAVDAEFNTEMMWHHLSFRSLPAPYTLFKSIYSLAPSEIIEVRHSEGIKTSNSIYWDPIANAGEAPRTQAEAAEAVEALLRESVVARLESDVPLGIFLSGGIDSGLLHDLMAEHTNELCSYTVTYPGHDEYNEHRNASILAGRRNTAHHLVELTELMYEETFRQVVYHQEEPIAAPVCSPVYHLSQKASQQGRKVIFAGEGSDELFIGYKLWRQTRDLQKIINTLPRWMGSTAGSVGGGLLNTCSSPYSRLPEAMSRLAESGQLFYTGGMDFSERAKKDLYRTTYKGPSTYEVVIEPIRQRFLDYGDSTDVTAWMSYSDLRFRLPQLMLPRLDRMGMAHSVEGRVPFLDHRLIELVFAMPGSWRGGSGRELKPLVRKAARKYLPDYIVDQPKIGFQAPVVEWKTQSFGKKFIPYIEKFNRETELFDPMALNRLLQSNDSRLYFSLVNLAVWYDIFIAKS